MNLNLLTQSGYSPDVRAALADDFQKTDRLMFRILLVHWLVASTVMGLFHGYYLLGLVGGGAIVALVYATHRLLPGSAYPRVMNGIALMLFSALFIQQSLGKIEIHFHIFVALALLQRYKDLKPLLAAVVTIALHHLLGNYCQQLGLQFGELPFTIFSYGSGLGIVLLHALFVVIEAALIGYLVSELTAQFAKAVKKNTEDEKVLGILRSAIERRENIGKLSDDSEYASVINTLVDLLRDNKTIRKSMEMTSNCLVLTDADLTVMDCNLAARKLFRNFQQDFASLNGFNADSPRGQSLKNVLQQAGGRSTETRSFETRIGSRSFALTLNPVLGDQNEVLAILVEWVDRSVEVAIEQEIEQLVALASVGQLSGRLSTQDKTGFMATLASGINRMLEETESVITDVSQVLSAVADGDLSRTIQGDYEGAFGALVRDVNSTIEKLESVVIGIRSSSQSVRDGVEGIAGDTAEIQMSVQDQLDSLEQISRSMARIKSTVDQSTAFALEAKQLGGVARQHADQGSGVVGETIAAMNEITVSSEKISSIIGVVEAIAFQTNLLALNASVEAARAGEQGRGFAVVAGEVRNLSGRSSEAAGEIRRLIEDSLHKVKRGAELAQESGHKLTEIAGRVADVTGVVQNIAKGAEEQVAEVGTVYNAIGLLQGAAEQNSSRVESSGQSSQALVSEAQNLEALVAYFKLGEHSRRQTTVMTGKPRGQRQFA